MTTNGHDEGTDDPATRGDRSPGRDGRQGVATLRDVAELAGVSISTASRALTGRRRVGVKTAERVVASARSLGYWPNEAARALKMSRSMTFGVTFFNLMNPVGLDLIDGLTGGSDERGFSLLVTSARGDADLYRRHIQRFFERRVDGLFLASPSRVESSVEPFRRAGAPVLALVSRGPECDGIPLLTVRESRAIDAAIERLAELGHRRIGYLTRWPSLVGRRRAALQKSTSARGMRLLVSGLGTPGDAGAAQRAIEPILRGEERATALFVDHREAATLVPTLRGLGATVPDDVSLVTFTDSRWTEGLAWPPIAAIHTHTFEMGRQAAQLMAAWLDGEEPPDVTALELAEWVERPSVGPAPA